MRERDRGYDCIRALATVMIVVFHFVLCAQEAKGAYAPRGILMFIDGRCNLGRLGVAWFTILSGSVLWKTHAGELDAKRFYAKRIVRIFIPLWIAYAFFYAISLTRDPGIAGVPFHSVLISLLGLDFYHYYFVGSWNLILVGEWYTSVIVTLYLLFPLLHWLFTEHRKPTTIAMLVLFALNLKLEILTTSDGAWSVVNAVVLFWMGMLFEEYEHLIADDRRVVLSSLVLAGFIFVFLRRSDLFGFSYLITFVFALLTYIAAYALLPLITWAEPAVRRISDLSYEIYLIHHRIFYLLVPVLVGAGTGKPAIVCVFLALAALICLLSACLSAASRAVRNRLPGNAGSGRSS